MGVQEEHERRSDMEKDAKGQVGKRNWEGEMGIESANEVGTGVGREVGRAAWERQGRGRGRGKGCRKDGRKGSGKVSGKKGKRIQFHRDRYSTCRYVLSQV